MEVGFVPVLDLVDKVMILITIPYEPCMKLLLSSLVGFCQCLVIGHLVAVGEELCIYACHPVYCSMAAPDFLAEPVCQLV